MCLTVPSRVIAIADGIATVEALGTIRACSLLMLEDEAVAVGDYLILGPGGAFATERIAPEDAQAALDLLTGWLADPSA